MPEEPRITVRAARTDELAKVSELFQNILRELPYYNSLAKENEARKYTPEGLKFKIANEQYTVLVSLNSDENIIGFSFSHFDDYTVWIDWFGVDFSKRRNGVGMSILNGVFETARMFKAHKVWCDCRSNNLPSKNLLRKARFRKIALVKNHWYGQDFILWDRFL